MNAVVNQWSEVSILWVLVLRQSRHSISHHTRDLDYKQLFTRLTLGMVNSCSLRLTELMFGKLHGISKLVVPTSVVKEFGSMVFKVLMKSSIIKL